MVMRTVSEEATWTNEGSTSSSEQPAAKKTLLSALMATLDAALSYLHGCLESHYAQATQVAGRNDPAATKAHSATVTAALGACCPERGDGVSLEESNLENRLCLNMSLPRVLRWADCIEVVTKSLPFPLKVQIRGWSVLTKKA